MNMASSTSRICQSMVKIHAALVKKLPLLLQRPQEASDKKPHQRKLTGFFKYHKQAYLPAAAFLSFSLAITASATLFGQGA